MDAVDDPRVDDGALLRRAHETRTLAAMLDALPALVAYVDADGHNRYANAAVLHWLGRSPREAAGMPVAALLGERYPAVRLRVQAAQAGVPQRFERLFPLPDGEVTNAQTEYLPCFRNGRPDGFYVLVTDVTRRVRAEAGHQAAVAQGALLEERNRTAADLHDTVLQRLFAAGLHLDRLRDNPAFSPDAVAATIDTIQSAIEDLRTSVRGLALGKGLSFPVTAFEQVLAASRPALGLVPDLVVRGDLGTLPEETVREILALLAELLAGAGRQPDVRTVGVRVTAAPGTAELRVTDDARGPVPAERDSDLAALRVRVHAMGGRLAVRRRAAGSSVTVWLPVPLVTPGRGAQSSATSTAAPVTRPVARSSSATSARDAG